MQTGSFLSARSAWKRTRVSTSLLLLESWAQSRAKQTLCACRNGWSRRSRKRGRSSSTPQRCSFHPEKSDSRRIRPFLATGRGLSVHVVVIPSRHTTKSLLLAQFLINRQIPKLSASRSTIGNHRPGNHPSFSIARMTSDSR